MSTAAEEVFEVGIQPSETAITEFERQLGQKQTDKLAEAMAKAQAEIMNAHKSESNPFFNSKYADLKSCWDACRGPLTKNGLSVVQLPEVKTKEDGKPWVTVKTLLLHSSGQKIENELNMPLGKADPHGVGSAITYARRYALAAMVGIAPEDDDGNAAAKGVSEPPKKS